MQIHRGSKGVDTRSEVAEFGCPRVLGQACRQLVGQAMGRAKDLHRQGGYLVLLSHPKVLREEAIEYIVLDWRSYRLPRVNRSSLYSEAQACDGAMDALEFLLIFWQGCMSPTFTFQDHS